MKNILKFLGVFTVGIMIFIAIYLVSNTGINKSSIEINARAKATIPSDWQVCQDTSEEISSLLFYDEKTRDYTFSIYTTKKDFSFGFFHRASGSLGPSMQNLIEFRIKGFDERIYMSTNKNLASKVTITNGDTIETIQLDASKPFTLILPVDGSIVTIYDVNDKIIEATPTQL